VIQLRVYFLGTGGAGGPSNRAHNCFIVESKECRLLVDFGEGCSWRLEELGLTLCDIDLVYISHKHIDHWIGLFDASVLALSKGCKSFNVLTHSNVMKDLKALLISTLPKEVSSNVIFHEINDDRYRFKDVIIKVIPSIHPVPTYGILITNGESTILYSADTSINEVLIGYLDDVELLIHEASLPSNLETLALSKGHTTVRQVLSLSRYMRNNAILTPVHLTKESEREFLHTRLEVSNNVRVILPSDGTLLKL